jgi:hypothetical protein
MCVLDVDRLLEVSLVLSLGVLCVLDVDRLLVV